jgi:phosphoribosylformylglycinamidine cyclo-ligase
VADKGNIPQATMYATFNMGIGFCVVVGKSEQQAALAALKQAGEDAVRIGWVTSRPGKTVSIPAAGLLGKGDAFEPVR